MPHKQSKMNTLLLLLHAKILQLWRKKKRYAAENAYLRFDNIGKMVISSR